MPILVILSVIMLGLCAPGARGAERVSLPLDEAERLALARDVGAPARSAQAQALREQSVADAQLPDPKLKLGAASLPTDTFSRSQEAMTQLQVGVVQSFPPGRTLALRGDRGMAMAEAAEAMAEAERLRVLRDTRIAWLEVQQQIEAERIIEQSRRYFTQLVDVTRAQYSSGHGNQQDVLRAELELSLLDDRLLQARIRQDEARSGLARLIGPAEARRPLAAGLPRLPAPPDYATLVQVLPRHPLVVVEDRRVAASRLGVNLARERYKPAWSLDVTYGDRVGVNPDGSDRADFLSAMVLVDMPLFPGKRQDRMLAASQKETLAASLARQDRLYELEQMLDAEHARWWLLNERHRRYEERLVAEAGANALAALHAYRSAVTGFNAVMRARITELDTRLDALRVAIDTVQSQARLLYLAGDGE